jgi:hypothetical protein
VYAKYGDTLMTKKIAVDFYIMPLVVEWAVLVDKIILKSKIAFHGPVD